MEEKKSMSMWTGKRLIIALLLGTIALVNYIDRVAVSVAGPVIAKEFHFDPADMGWIFGSFLWSYVAFLIPSGWLTDRLGMRRVNAWAVGIWSLAVAATAGVTGFYSLIAARLGLGMGEAATFPTGGKVIRYWFPAKERALASAFFLAGTALGPAIAAPIVASLVTYMGWRYSFVLLGSLGFLWVVAWLKWFHQPEDAKWLPEDERQYILANRAVIKTEGEADKPIGIGSIVWQIIRQRTYWGIVCGYSAIAYVLYFIWMWLPSYLVSSRGMTLMTAGIYSSIPFLIGAIAAIYVGWTSDRLLTPEQVKAGRRKLYFIISLLISGSIVFTNYAVSSMVAMVMITIALAASMCAQTLVYSLISDVTADQRITASVYGTVLICSNSVGMVSSIATGYIVKATGGAYTSAFLLCGAVVVVGALLCYALVGRPIEYRDSQVLERASSL